VIQGETFFSGAKVTPCEHCGNKDFPLKVLKTCAWYVGTQCSCGMPMSRETDYFATEEEAQAALDRLKRADLSDLRGIK
jgi:hypothetical protein